MKNAQAVMYVETPLGGTLPGDDPVEEHHLAAIVEHYSDPDLLARDIHPTGAHKLPQPDQWGSTHLVGLRYTDMWDGVPNPDACALYGLDVRTGRFQLYAD